MYFKKWSDAEEWERKRYGEEEYNRRESIKLQAAKELIRQIDPILADARSRRCTFFACSLKRKIGSPIVIMFCDETGGYFRRSLNYARFCKENGVIATLGDAVDIKVEVQSYVLNQEDIEPAKRGALLTLLA